MNEFWSTLTDSERDAFRRRATTRHWQRGDVLFREADQSGWVAALVTGRVKASCHSASGTEILLAVRGPGALLGELSAVDRLPRSATVQALDPVTALVMPPAGFQEYLQQQGRVAFQLMRLLAERLRDADRKRIEFGAQDSTGRVAARLVELAERFGTPVDNGIHVAVRLSQDELAGWIGASREAVTKSLRVLRDSGWVRTSRLSVVVLDLDALRRRAAGYPPD
ncbi:Crp/Fnr family transcriptional regulator [Salinispora arenicola]|uniref:Crp/Fnr family transcriptional regulator n=1 Tax=Salinispora arenicola TaxID=168697 RepID=UPI0003A96122|nr:Crp/Fnr family transcriptional regulator [Salinispora arenicola]